MDEFHTKFNKWNNELSLRIQVCQDSLDALVVKHKQLLVKTEDIENIQKTLITKSDKLSSKLVKQDSNIKERSETLRNDLLELIGKSQRQLEKQYNNILKDIENSKDEMVKIVDTSKEFTLQKLSIQTERIEEVMDSVKKNLLQTNETERRIMKMN